VKAFGQKGLLLILIKAWNHLQYIFNLGFQAFLSIIRSISLRAFLAVFSLNRFW